jgi:hypothetical protein
MAFQPTHALCGLLRTIRKGHSNEGTREMK